MAPELLNSIDARELVEIALKIRDYQLAKKISDNALVKKFSGLGSTKTYTRVIGNDLSELDLERQLANYRAVWALIESMGNEAERQEIYLDDFGPVVSAKKALLESWRETGNARFIIVEGDTGLGKTGIARALVSKYGQRILPIEATDVWKDNPGAFLSSILLALGVKECPPTAVGRLQKVIERLRETRVTLLVDEGHHLGVHCLNACKTIINQTPGEIMVLAYPTLWRRIERESFDEVRQLTGNRLAERVKLALRESDILKMIRSRVPDADEQGLRAVVKALIDRAPRYGNLAFVRDVCARVLTLSEGTSGPDLDCWSTAISEEVASR